MKMAILGAGSIAVQMATTINGMKEEGVVGYAIAARDLERAEAFAKEWGFEKAYGSYEDMLNDEEVDLVYVATPHSHHYDHVKLCLEHGKHVLCEKAFMANAKQAKEIIALAKEKNLLVAEAIWTRYLPARKMIQDLMESGIIGKVSTLQGNLGYSMAHKTRVQEPALAGGALLDVGVYVINFAFMVFGSSQIKEIQSTAFLSEKGVDLRNTMTIVYEDGKVALLHSNAVEKTDRRGIIHGDKGYIEIENINNCEALKVFDISGELVKELEIPEQITGFEYEVRACMEALKAGQLECSQMPHDEIITVMEVMDGLRAEWGVVYPFE